jgi:hypothetical protein
MRNRIWRAISESLPEWLSERTEPLKIILSDLLPINTIQGAREAFSDTDWRLFFFRMAAFGYILVLISVFPIIIFIISERAVGSIEGPINLISSVLTVLVLTSIGLYIFASVASDSIDIILENENVGEMDTGKRRIGDVLMLIIGVCLLGFGMAIFSIISASKFTFGGSLSERLLNSGFAFIIILLQTGTVLAGLGFMFMWIFPPSEKDNSTNSS